MTDLTDHDHEQLAKLSDLARQITATRDELTGLRRQLNTIVDGVCKAHDFDGRIVMEVEGALSSAFTDARHQPRAAA